MTSSRDANRPEDEFDICVALVFAKFDRFQQLLDNFLENTSQALKRDIIK
jgi:hypothetical protein